MITMNYWSLRFFGTLLLSLLLLLFGFNGIATILLFDPTTDTLWLVGVSVSKDKRVGVSVSKDKRAPTKNAMCGQKPENTETPEYGRMRKLCAVGV